jgi:serine/threonine protein kinase HipA of HipAB toxin-antitoxin module
VVQNCRALTYLGPREIRASAGAALDSGALSLTLLRRSRPHDMASVLVSLFLGRAAAVLRHPQVDGVARLQAATVTSVDGDPLPLDADGEFLGLHSRVTYGVRPGALRVAI